MNTIKTLIGMTSLLQRTIAHRDKLMTLTSLRQLSTTHPKAGETRKLVLEGVARNQLGIVALAHQAVEDLGELIHNIEHLGGKLEIFQSDIERWLGQIEAGQQQPEIADIAETLNGVIGLLQRTIARRDELMTLTSLRQLSTIQPEAGEARKLVLESVAQNQLGVVAIAHEAVILSEQVQMLGRELTTAQAMYEQIRDFYLTSLPLGELAFVSMAFLKLFQTDPLVLEIICRNMGKKNQEMVTNVSENEIDRLTGLFNSFYTPHDLRFQVTCVALTRDFPEAEQDKTDDHNFRHPQMGFLFTVDKRDGSTAWNLGPNIYSYPDNTRG